MKHVIIIKGAYGYKPEGSTRTRAKTRADGPIDLDDAEAERLVNLGIAEYVPMFGEDLPIMPVATPDRDENDGDPGENPPDNDDGSQEPETGDAHLDVSQLMEMTRTDMVALAADMGVDVSKCKNKAEIAEMLAAVPVDADGEDDGEDPPELEPEAPET